MKTSNHPRRTILIGQAPARRAGPPLAGRIGARLASLAELSPAEYLAAFERRNVLERWPGKDGKGDRFPPALARSAAARMTPSLRRRRVIFLGRATARAFGFGEDLFAWKNFCGFEAAAFPHPSGVNRWWNDPPNVARAADFLTQEIRAM